MFVFVNDEINKDGIQTVIEVGEFPQSFKEELDRAGVEYEIGFGTLTIVSEEEALKIFTRD